MRRFEPVHLPDGAWPDRGISVTLGGRMNQCPRSAFLAMKYGGGPRSHEMISGGALHRVLQLGTEAMIEEARGVRVVAEGDFKPTAADARTQAGAWIPPELMKDFCNEVFADPEYAPPVEFHDYVREAAFRWASCTTLDPSTVVACERLFELDLCGTVLRGKIDLALLLDGGARVEIRDFKSARSMPAQEEISRKRPDGTLAAKQWQLVCYGLLVAYGVPVRVEDCMFCGGRGGPLYGNDLEPEQQGQPCPCCNGSGRIETREPFGLAPRAEQFDLSYVFPGIETENGMGKREASLTRTELVEYRASVESVIARMMAARESGDWPAVPDTGTKTNTSGHCQLCPAARECPIPDEVRTHAGRINTEEECAEAALRAEFDREQLKARDKEIKAFVKTLPGSRLRFGPHYVYEPGYQAAEKIRDKSAMWSAIEQAVQYGAKFDPADHVQTVESTPLRVRKLSGEELAAEAETETEEEQDGAGDLDARFGAAPPF